MTHAKELRNNGTLTVKAAAAVLRMSIRHLHRLADKGELPCWRVPGNTARRFLAAEVVAFARRHGIPFDASRLGAMKMQDALTMAREQGCKVRPVYWGGWVNGSPPWIEYDAMRAMFAKVYPNGDVFDDLQMNEGNLIGDWEVVS